MQNINISKNIDESHIWGLPQIIESDVQGLMLGASRPQSGIFTCKQTSDHPGCDTGVRGWKERSVTFLRKVTDLGSKTGVTTLFGSDDYPTRTTYKLDRVIDIPIEFGEATLVTLDGDKIAKQETIVW